MRRPFLQQATVPFLIFIFFQRHTKIRFHRLVDPLSPAMGHCLSLYHNFVIFFFKPLVQSTSTSLKDTKDLLILLEALTIEDDTTTLVTLDMENLYTCIPQDDTIKVNGQALDKVNWEYLTTRTFVMDCLTLVLKRNYFEYKGTLYLQKTGTSMSGTCAASIAGLYVHDFETKYVLDINNLYFPSILFWKRYRRRFDDMARTNGPTDHLPVLDKYAGPQFAIYTHLQLQGGDFP